MKKLLRATAVLSALLLCGGAIEAQPSNVSIAPASGSGAAQNFTVTAASSDWGNDGTVQLIFNWTSNGPGACYALYYQAANLLYLTSDDGSQWLGGLAPGAAGSVSNSQCTLNSQSSSVSASGNNLSVTFALTFKPSFIGPQLVWTSSYDATGQDSSWQQMGTWTAYAAPSSQPPCVSSQAPCTVSPAQGTAMGAQFTFTSQDLNGARYIVAEDFYFGPNANPGCIVLAYHYNNAAYLLSDNGSQWLPIPSGGSAGNSQCTIYGTSGSDSGNSWIYTFTAAFQPGFAGASKPVYVFAYDQADQVSGMQQVGTWTVPTNPTDNALCSSMSVPSTLLPGAAIPFTVTMQNNGTSNWIGQSLNSSNFMYLGINPWDSGGAFGNMIYISLPGTPPIVYPGQLVTFSSANASASVLAPSTPGTYTFSWMIGHQGGPDWTFGAACSQQVTVQSPINVSVTPASGSAPAQNFTVTAASSDWGNDGTVQLLFNWTSNGPGACYALYYQAANLLYLTSDDGSQWLGGLTPGAAGSVSNSQCTLNSQSSSVSASGNNLSVTFALTFKPSFIGPQLVWTSSYDATGRDSSWQQMGTWTAYAAPSSQPPCAPSSQAPCTVTPAQGTGMGAQFTFTSQDLNGARYIVAEDFYFGPNANPGCIVLAYHYNNAAYLLSDNGSQWIAIPSGGSAGNSQCTISGTSGSDSGNSWIYTFTAAFQPSFSGASKPVYVFAYDQDDQVSGMQQVGTWNVEPPSDFTISLTPAVSPSIAMAGGSAASYTVTVNPVAGSGFNSQVTLAANLPPGFTATFGSNTISSGAGQTTMSIFAPAGGTGNITASVTGTSTSPSLTHTATGGILAIQDFTFPLSPSASSNLSAASGTTGTWTLGPLGLNNFSQPINLFQTQYYPPYGSSIPGCSFPSQLSFPQTVTPGQTVQVGLSIPSNALNNYQCGIAVGGTYGGATHIATGILLVTSTGDFYLTPPAQQTASAGGSANFSLAYQPFNGFGGTVGFSVTGLPTGATASFAPFTSGYGSTMSVAVPAGVLAGTYPLTLTGANTAASISHVVYSSLVVQGGQGFSISANPTSPQPIAPGGTATYNVAVNSSGGYTGAVSLSASGGPPGASVSLSSYSVAAGGSVTMTVVTPSNATPQPYTVNLSASSGGVTRYGAAQLNVAGFAPASILTPLPGAIPGGSTNFTWNTGTGATKYILSLGASPGGTNYGSFSVGSAQSATVSVPAVSSVYVTLSSFTASGWVSQGYVYTVPSAGPTITLGTSTLSLGGKATIAPSLNGDTLTGCSAQPGIASVLAPSALSVILTASSSAQLGQTQIACSTAAAKTVLAPLLVQLGGPQIWNVQLDSTPSPDGTANVDIEGAYFGAGWGYVSVSGGGSSSGQVTGWEGSDDGAPNYATVLVSGLAVGCFVYEFELFADSGEASASAPLCYEAPPPPPSVSLSPSKVVMGAGGQFSLTALAAGTSGYVYAWTLVATQSGDDPTVAQFCNAQGACSASQPGPTCNGQATCVATIQGVKGGKATVQVTVADVNSNQATAQTRLIVIQITQLTVTATASVGGSPATQSSPPPQTASFSTQLPIGALQWPSDPAWLSTTPAPLVFIENSMPNVQVSATTVPAANDPDVALAFSVIRAPDDAAYVGAPSSVPRIVVPSSAVATFTLDQRGSFQVLAFVDTNGNGIRDNNETGASFPVIVVEALFNSNLSVGHSVNIDPEPLSTLTRINTGNNEISDPVHNASDLNALVDFVGGGPSGGRGTERVFGTWVQNEQSESTWGTYGTSPSLNYFKWVPIENPSATTKTWGSRSFPIFLPGGTPPLLWALPLLDGLSTAGGGGSTSGMPDSGQTFIQALAYGNRYQIEAVDSPAAPYPNFHPAFENALTQFQMVIGFQTYLLVWASSNDTGAATNTVADRTYSLLASQPWSISAIYSVSGSGVITDVGTPTVTLDPNAASSYSSAVPLSGAPPILVPPALLFVLGINAQN